MKQETLISYALSFSSFLLDSTIGVHIEKIILFGSVARGDFTKESDIDLFIEADERFEKDIDKSLLLFESSQVYKIWKMKGVEHAFSLKVGHLSQWKLKREVLSSGIILYGKNAEMTEGASYYLLIQLQEQKKTPASQMRFWRKLYGYTQKVGIKSYSSKGLIEQVGGKKLGKALFLLPMEKRKVILDFLAQNKIQYVAYEIWSDAF